MKTNRDLSTIRKNGCNLKTKLDNIISRIQKAALACNREPDSIRLVAVSKTKPVEQVLEAIEAGVTTFGENYIQEAREKINTLSAYPISWHFIGHLQTNKAKFAVKLFDLIHSVDTLKLAVEINRQAEKSGKLQPILIQVNIAEEASKSGARKQDTLNLVQDISGMKNLSIKGLMTMPPFYNDPEKARPFFSALRNLRDLLQEQAIPNVSMTELSMGMTGDFETAIEEGATLVRIGTAIFGQRN